jgi:hypothetical protein
LNSKKAKRRNDTLASLKPLVSIDLHEQSRSQQFFHAVEDSIFTRRNDSTNLFICIGVF